MTSTIRLALTIGIVWAAGILSALVVRTLLPDDEGLKFTSAKSTLFDKFNQIGFRTCQLAARTVRDLVVIGPILTDIGWLPRGQ